jgi:hypothetical protein
MEYASHSSDRFRPHGGHKPTSVAIYLLEKLQLMPLLIRLVETDNLIYRTFGCLVYGVLVLWIFEGNDLFTRPSSGHDGIRDRVAEAFTIVFMVPGLIKAHRDPEYGIGLTFFSISVSNKLYRA